VDAGVDHQPGGPPGLGRQHPKPFVVVRVQAHLVGQPLAVQAPSLDERGAHGDPPEASERRAPRELLLDRHLEVMARVRLVVGDRGEL
jgi:hypothetical protein